ncbi:hypothetical protein MKW92_030177 [Papaver armeniacum]|nr:hypothetical protein MKW92_030177 [Papaver armeniacum]
MAASAAKISFLLGCIIASILLQSVSLNAQRITCTGYEGFVPWDGTCGGIGVVETYQENAYQNCSWWCLRTMFAWYSNIKCAQITYEETSGRHVCTCYDTCSDS